MTTARYRYGDTNPQNAPFKSAVAVQIGDLSFLDETDSYTLKPAGSYSWQSAIATPSAPTVANTATAVGSPLTNSATGVKISYQFPWGEGALSSAGSATPTAAARLLVSGAPLLPPAPALWTNIYVETAAGSGTYKLWGISYGESVNVDTYGGGRTPPASPLTVDATLATQYQFAQRFVGVAAQRYDGSNANAYGIKDGLIRYSTSGVYAFDCAAATFNADDLVGPAKQTGNALEPQKVVLVGNVQLAVGRVVQPYTSNTTLVLVEIFPGRSNLGNQPSL